MAASALVNNELLTADSFKQMTTKAVLRNNKTTGYGLGLSLNNANGRPAIRHGGGINGFRSDLVYYPDTEHTIVVLANYERTNPAKISNSIAAVLFEK